MVKLWKINILRISIKKNTVLPHVEAWSYKQQFAQMNWYLFKLEPEDIKLVHKYIEVVEVSAERLQIILEINLTHEVSGCSCFDSVFSYWCNTFIYIYRYTFVKLKQKILQFHATIQIWFFSNELILLYYI